MHGGTMFKNTLQNAPVYRVSLVEGFDFWEIGSWAWEHTAIFRAEEFAARLKDKPDWQVNVHEIADGRRLVHSITSVAARGVSVNA